MDVQASDVAGFSSDFKFLIVSYSIVKALAVNLKALNVKVIIADECHYLKVTHPFPLTTTAYLSLLSYPLIINYRFHFININPCFYFPLISTLHL